MIVPKGSVKHTHAVGNVSQPALGGAGWNVPEGERLGNVRKIVCVYIEETIRLCTEPPARQRGANRVASRFAAGIAEVVRAFSPGFRILLIQNGLF